MWTGQTKPSRGAESINAGDQVAPWSVENVLCTLVAPNRNRVHVTYRRSWNGLPTKRSTASHSLSLSFDAAEPRPAPALTLNGPATIAPVLGRDDLARIRDVVRRVIVGDEILAYVADLVRATRDDVHFSLGASPRAGLMLLRAAKANAAVEGRDFVVPEDVQRVWLPTTRHRVVLDPAAEVEGLTADRALDRSLASVPVPH